jgi:hypothetical protein
MGDNKTPAKYDIFVREYEDPTKPLSVLTVDDSVNLEELYNRLMDKIPSLK